MITQIRAENFKSWKDTGELPLAPLTGLFGTNSSGKSSILQMLLMLKQTAESSDRNRVLHTGGDERSLVNLGTFSDLIHNHDLNESLRLYISWRKDIKELSFQTIIFEYQGRNLVEQFLYEFPTGMQFAKSNKIEQKSILGMKRKSKNEDIYDLISNNLDAKLIKERSESQFVPIKCYGFPYSLISNQDDFHPADLSYYFENRFSAIYYLGPLRNYPERIYTWSEFHPFDIGTKGENTIAALLAAQVTGQRSFTGKKESRSNKRINEIILEWLQYMKLLESFNIKPIAKGRKDYEVKVKKNKSSSEVLITDVGFGVSQILPVLVLCYYVPDGAIILLEQPEIHLHPSVQADLADALVDVVMNRNVQIILESHSEHLLRRLQRRIAEGRISSDKVNLYFCRTENGASQIEKLQLDDEGYISNWPPNFFGDEMADLVAMTEAAIKRRENE
jgi:predicted ATPase